MNKKKEGIKFKSLMTKIIYGFLIVSLPLLDFSGEDMGSSADEVIFLILSFLIFFSILVLIILGCSFTSNSYFERVVNGSIYGFYGLLFLTISSIVNMVLDYIYWPDHFYYTGGIFKTLINLVPYLFILLVSCLMIVIGVSFIVSFVQYFCSVKVKKKTKKK